MEVDQLDAVSVAAFEHMMRRAQLIEHFHKERTRLEASGASTKPVMDGEEQQVFMGVQFDQGALMICPELVQHTAKELERQSAIDKQSRKAREERALRRKS